MKRIIIALALGIFVTAPDVGFAQNSSQKMVYTYVDQMPEFDGEVTEYLQNNLKYPKEAEKKGLEGKVIVRFTIEQDGQVGDIEVVRSVNPLLDAEAERVIREMPRWKPAVADGKAVAALYTVPVLFKLDKKASSVKPVK